MQFIPLAHQEDYSAILKYINAYKNGVTSDSLKSYGVDYDKNYGVSMVDLKRIASRYDNHHQLATILWQKGWRETYILATLLDQADKYTLTTLSERVNESKTYELLEQLAFNLAWQLDFLDDYFATISNWDLHKQYFLIKCTTYQLMKKTITADTAWNRIQQYQFDDNASLLSILQNLLLRISPANKCLQDEIVAHCKAQQTSTWDTLADVIREYGD